MIDHFLNLFYPRSCCICNYNGYYICPSCKKLFKRNLPECHVCRRLSPSYLTHTRCKQYSFFDGVFVAWEYNKVCSRILKNYKYKNVYDISRTLSEFFVEALIASSFKSNLKDTLLIPIPISFIRRNERGFNQMDIITKYISKNLNLDMNNNILKCNYTNTHQAQKCKDERISRENPFYIVKGTEITNYKSITIVDDVITTGSTLNLAAQTIRPYLNKDTKMFALCLFRGSFRAASRARS